MTDAPKLHFTTDGPVATVTLNRPDQRNSIDADLCSEIRATFDAIEADPAIRVTVFTGAGKVFCAGMDLRAFANGQEKEILFGQYGFAGFVARKRTKPVIAAVEGAALAGGFEIMLACDMVYAGGSALLGLPEPKVGLFAGGGGAIRLANRIPRVLANQILLSGQPIDARAALGWGLINAAVPDGGALDAARAMAAVIAANAPLGVAEGLRLSDMAATTSEAALWQENEKSMIRIGASKDSREGARAFIEKRAPVWRGE